MAFNMIDIEDKRTDELLKEVAELQEFEAMSDELTSIIEGDEAELNLDEMDMVRAAGGRRPIPSYEEFLKKINSGK